MFTWRKSDFDNCKPRFFAYFWLLSQWIDQLLTRQVFVFTVFLLIANELTNIYFIGLWLCIPSYHDKRGNRQWFTISTQPFDWNTRSHILCGHTKLTNRKSLYFCRFFHFAFFLFASLFTLQIVFYRSEEIRFSNYPPTQQYSIKSTNYSKDLFLFYYSLRGFDARSLVWVWITYTTYTKRFI